MLDAQSDPLSGQYFKVLIIFDLLMNVGNMLPANVVRMTFHFVGIAELVVLSMLLLPILVLFGQ